MRYRQPYTLLKRGKYWYFRVYDSDGARVMTSTGKKTKDAAIEFVLDLVKHGKLLDTRTRHAQAKPMTFGRFADGWWTASCKYVRESALLGHKLSGSYLDHCRNITARWLVPKFGGCRLLSIRRPAIEQWRFSLVEDGKLSPKMANNILSVLSTMLSQAVREELIPANPCKGIRKMAGGTKERGILTLDEARTLFSSVDIWNGNAMAMTANLLAACTGMRSREVAALRGMDIHDGWIHVAQSFDEVYGLKGTKTGDVRNLPIPPQVMARLNALKRKDDDWLFTLDGIKPVAQHYFLYALHKALEKIGVDWKARNIVFHSWRHFLNSVLINGNISADITRHMTGHETKEMTERYLHFDATQFAGVLDVTSAIVKDTR